VSALHGFGKGWGTLKADNENQYSAVSSRFSGCSSEREEHCARLPIADLRMRSYRLIGHPVGSHSCLYRSVGPVGVATLVPAEGPYRGCGFVPC